jgi:hypothetical protein
VTPEARWRKFLGRYEPGIGRQAAAARKGLRQQLAGAFELVYDNYNALVMAFGGSDRHRDIILSIALYPRWVTLFFAQGSTLPDPDGLLEGAGARIRGVRLTQGRTVNDPAVRALVSAASAGRRLAGGRLVIKSVSAKQRPRRPA